MSKIICEVCGTSYPETAAQCPICGSVRSPEPKTINGNSNAAGARTAGTYTYVKGGRYSKKNVKKRIRESCGYAADAAASETEDQRSNSKGEVGLTIAIIALLLAIAAMVVYIILNFFGPFDNDQNAGAPSTTETVTTATEDTTPSVEATVPCVDLTVESVITLNKLGMSQALNVVPTPEDTTDPIRFESADESIVTVDTNGVITATAEGETVITITCGSVSKQCRVICSFVPVLTEPIIEFQLNREDFTLSFKGDSWVLYDGVIPKSEINWRSSNESVATVYQGKVVAVAPGYAYIYAEYDGVQRSCIVHCTFKK